MTRAINGRTDQLSSIAPSMQKLLTNAPSVAQTVQNQRFDPIEIGDLTDYMAALHLRGQNKDKNVGARRNRRKDRQRQPVSGLRNRRVSTHRNRLVPDPLQDDSKRASELSTAGTRTEGIEAWGFFWDEGRGGGVWRRETRRVRRGRRERRRRKEEGGRRKEKGEEKGEGG